MALEFLFNPLLGLQPALAILIFSAFVLFIINIFYKVLIKQHLAKAIKDRQKELSKRMQEERKAGNMDKMNALMKESLSENSKLMRMTMKPMIVSFVVVIIFLPWLHSVYGDVTAPMQNNTGIAALGGINHSFSINGKTLSSDFRKCDGNCFIINNRTYEVMKEGNAMKFAPIVATFPFSMPLLGYNVGWLGWYILVSIPLVVILRKLMKIYV
jgi:uncharacterized membrane protein (DUF106 family)